MFVIITKAPIIMPALEDNKNIIIEKTNIIDEKSIFCFLVASAKRLKRITIQKIIYIEKYAGWT